MSGEGCSALDRFKPIGPYQAFRRKVLNGSGEMIAYAASESVAEQIAADMNLADSVAAEPGILTTVALHRRDQGDTVRTSVAFCGGVLPRELRAAMAAGKSAANLLGIGAKVVDFQRVRHGGAA